MSIFGKKHENKDDAGKETIEIERKTLDNKVDKHTIVVGDNSDQKQDINSTEPL